MQFQPTEELTEDSDPFYSEPDSSATITLQKGMTFAERGGYLIGGGYLFGLATALLPTWFTSSIFAFGSKVANAGLGKSKKAKVVNAVAKGASGLVLSSGRKQTVFGTAKGGQWLDDYLERAPKRANEFGFYGVLYTLLEWFTQTAFDLDPTINMAVAATGATMLVTEGLTWQRRLAALSLTAAGSYVVKELRDKRLFNMQKIFPTAEEL
eukprot:TRINITY_DN1595_c0_g1_i1.p1 TRINITY_DN1595_c0_g1~~TRINITY_DN1595_c0_g1_i1.p1  ORF type:complete len:210 (+),score=48.00 TRINITY_DN1595_c0_g1_i1:136-765(+)